MNERASTPPVPRHENAEPHRKLMEKLANMTDAQIVETSVRAGIHTKAGKLTQPYAEPPPTKK